MFQNYLKVALRSLWRQRGYAVINIFGLAVGMACCILIMLFVRNEWSFDRFHDDADRLYRAWVLEDYYEEGQQFFNTVTPLPLGPTLADTYPEVESYTRVATFGNLVQHGEMRLTETIHLADANFFEVFSFPLVQGTPGEVLRELNSVVLTETAATRYFGEADPVGQTLSIRVGPEAFEDFLVTGVAQDPPTNTGIAFSLVLPFEVGTGRQWSERALNAWFNVRAETYVLLREGTEVQAIEAKLPAMVANVLGDQVEAGQYTVGLQPLTDIHLNPDMPAGIAPVSDPAYAYILAAIALFILLIACINFVTLSIGRSAGRALEVGVRKVVGAGRRQLMAQFWGEALLMTLVAVVLGLALAQVALPLFNGLAGQQLTMAWNATLVLFLVGLLVVVGLLSGVYPALVLSGFRPIEVLKGRFRLSGDTSFLRRGLIVVQFGLSVFLIASTLIMRAQLSYLQEKSLGFDREQVVVIPTAVAPDEGFALIERFRNEVAARTEVAGIAGAWYTFGQGPWMQIGYGADDGSYREFMLNVVDPDYIRTMGMTVVQGRDFSREITSDAAQAIIVNEAFVAEYGWDNPIGARLPGPFEAHQVIGVVADFNYASLHTAVRPLMLVLDLQPIRAGISDVSSGQSRQPKLFARLQPGAVPAGLALLEQTWQAVAPDRDFAFTFLDETVESQYRREERLGQMVGIASLLSILIACLGLFGLTALAVVRRTKEIGVRKVMGASTPGIVVLLSKDFTVLVAVAFLLAVPATFFFVSPWLDGFAYRIGLGPWPFLAAGMLALLIAWLTVSYQALKAARTNPADALRYE